MDVIPTRRHGYDPRYRNACTSWMLWNFFSTCFYIVCRYPKKETFLLCFLGLRTMPIYLFHGLIYSVLKATPLLNDSQSPLETWRFFCSRVLLSFAFLRASKPLCDMDFLYSCIFAKPPKNLGLPPVFTFGKRNQAQP